VQPQRIDGLQATMKATLGEWQEVFSLLDTALDLPPVERAAWLQGLSGSSAAMKTRLENLLAQNARLETGDFLAMPPAFDVGAAQLFLESTEVAAPLDVGTRVGAYRLERELGFGGMGRVWLARRVDGQLDRQVALKLPFAGPFQRELMIRFARERDILAALTHPNIARLYDAGITENGQAYLALEYVEGVPVTTYCSSRTLPVGARLDLFRQVLQAVKYAHASLVIHRDLKPSNILVTDDGNVRLLDFGIAKLMIAGEAKETLLTEFAGRALTPEYASPEQIAGSPLNTASDVYSLGVVLYELLTGERPYRLTRESRAALEDAVLAADPVRPSQALRDPTCAAAAGLAVAKTRRALTGDLDTIILKALKKKPAERYATVDAFLQDIERHQLGEPVLARPDSALYRCGRFVRRHRYGMGSAFGAAAILIAGTFISVRQAHVARDEATRAQRESRHAQAVQEFLVNIFRTNTHLQADPIKARQTTARDMLDVGAARVDETLHDVPDAEAEVLMTLGDMYTQMGLDGQASKLRLLRIDALKRARGTFDPEVAEALLDYAEDVSTTRDRMQSMPAVREAERILDAAHDHTSEIRAELWMEYGRFYRYTDPEKMRRYEDTAVQLLENGMRDTWTYVLALAMAAQARFERGAYAEAEILFHRSIDQVHRREPGESAWEISPFAQLAATQAARLNIAEAERNFRASLAVTDKLNGQSHFETLQSGARLGAFLHATSRRAEGLKFLEAAVGELDRDPDQQGSATAALVRGLYGRVLLEDGRFEAAEPYIATATGDTLLVYPQSSLLADDLLSQAELFTALGRFADADRILKDALAIRSQVGGSADVPARVNPFLLARARLALAEGDAATAMDWVRQLHKAVASEPPPLDLDDVAARLVLSSAYMAQNRLIDAQQQARGALLALQQSPLRSYFGPIEAAALLALGGALQRAGDARSALPLLESALKLYQAAEHGASPRSALAQAALAECLFDLGERERARRLFRQARAIVGAHPALGSQYRQPVRDLAVRLGVPVG
jgi:eukaryotic-like serine/threonine-protein kinase